MHVRPVDLGGLRDELLEFTALRGADLFATTHADTLKRMFAASGLPDAAAWLATDEAARLRHCDLYHVAAPMMAVAWAAAPTLPSFELLPEDLPSSSGFIYFEAPMDESDEVDGEQIRTVAASWAPIDTRLGLGRDGMWVRWYVKTPGLMRPTRLIMIGDVIAPFGVNPAGWFHGNGVGVRSTLVLKTIWLLMSQRIGLVDLARYDRASLRRLKRMRKEPPPVRVVTLRRPQGATAAANAGRDYHHQWIVRGHWRQQWFPARQVHRPVWISPHIKGPEGAPLLGGEKVYALRR